MSKEVKYKLIEIGAGILLYALAIFSVYRWDAAGTTEFLVFLLAYAALTAGTVWQMLKEFRRFRFFDENVLMLMATVGAMLIGKYTEAVGAMLFFQIGKLIEEISLSRTKNPLQNIWISVRRRRIKRWETEKKIRNPQI